MPNYDDDDELADAVQSGDPNAYEAFFNRFQQRLIRYAISRDFPFHDADDLAQEAIFIGWKDISSFIRGHSLSSWLSGIELNLMRRRWAEAAKGQTLSLDMFDEDGGVGTLGISAEAVDPGQSAQLAKLWVGVQINMPLAHNQTYMKAVSLRYFDHLSFQEIEAALDLKPNVAKVYVQRGLKVLKEMEEAPTPLDTPRNPGGRGDHEQSEGPEAD